MVAKSIAWPALRSDSKHEEGTFQPDRHFHRFILSESGRPHHAGCNEYRMALATTPFPASSTFMRDSMSLTLVVAAKALSGLLRV
jgi:hypothetical protein